MSKKRFEFYRGNKGPQEMGTYVGGEQVVKKPQR